MTHTSRTASGLWLATVGLAAACFVVLTVRPAQAQERDAPGLKTESPYFFVKGGDAALDALPLKSTRVEVQISGVIADVTVTQHYRNEGQRAIEANYVFPGSTRAAVHGMTVQLAERLISAQIREKQQARAEYDTAKKDGKTAALLEQHRPNVFQMNVANILPGDDVQVTLRYTELLLPTGGQYSFVFPTVVGPRYHAASSGPAALSWVSQAFLAAPAPASFDIRVSLSTPLGIKALHSPSHEVTSTQDKSGASHVRLTPSAAPANNRDFILDYRLAGEGIESGLMLYKGGDENFFLAMIEPPKAVPLSIISPRDYIFVVDVSGSMRGFPLDTAKTLMRELLGTLRASDTFNVLLFAGSNRFLSPHSVPATGANIDQAVRTIDEMGGGGSTELIPALKRVYAEPKPADLARTIVVVTDGYVSVEREAFELVRNNLSQANLFSFGIGAAVNRHLMEGLARAGMGEPFIITQPAQASAQAARFRQLIESPVLTSVNLRFEGLDVYDVTPAQLPDVLAERPVMVMGKWRGAASGALVVSGQTASGPYRQSLPIANAPGHRLSSRSAALRQLWARQRIASLSDQAALEGGDALSQPITELGLRYGLLTAYTSFVAVDQQLRNPAPPDSGTVNQPSPLPQGVSPLALGAVVPSTPEPATWGAVLVLLSVLALLARRARRHNPARYTA